MTPFSRLARFECEELDSPCFADFGPELNDLPRSGAKVEGYMSYEDLVATAGAKALTFKRLLAPLPRVGIPIYCVGLNYRSHAKEAELAVPSDPPLWTKPVAALAHPDEDISINDFCAKSLLDYEAELVFVTSKKCRDVTPAEAKNFILGYTIGNDLSCRKFQMPGNMGGQFFYAKAFDHFAPIGPTLICPELYEKSKHEGVTLKVNGELRQRADIHHDMIFSPERILSHMSQGTTIPAGTAVMTGTPEGVGAFRKPKVFLQDGDIVEITMPTIGTLRNKIMFE
ncbi:hypothetical protein BKA63DRAFT_568934 [Paraphoma chrysanthemicola]|nr:hypothetical protein BKA63DRAFT_568934 [Paraphoma chrysanthemicola]